MENHRYLKSLTLSQVFSLLIFSVFPCSAMSQTVRINEFMALNSVTLTDEDGDYSDWIEIYNSDSTTVNLKNWSLTDDPSMPDKWVFPDISLEADGYLVVFASGKDRNLAGSELHTNFKLSGNGEYLALFDSNGAVSTEFSPFFPLQQQDISYAYLSGSWQFTTDPTPGEVNLPGSDTLLTAPLFNVKHGFFDTPFNLEITGNVPGANIVYTTDGSRPSLENGSIYTAPLNISTTSVIRAACLMPGHIPGPVTTRTYLFPDSIIRQPNDPPGYPATWGSYTAISDTSIADYEMDPKMMSDTMFADSVKVALRDLPVISLVTHKGFLFSHSTDPDSGGIYIYTDPPGGDGTGHGWERPVSMEYFDAKDSVSFQADCGIRLHGGHSRRPEKDPKHSFRLIFRSEYGPSQLNYPLFGNDATAHFNSLILRAGFGNTWTHHSYTERAQAQYLRDTWAKDTQLDMGHPASHGNFVHLYINGIYWGLFNPTERLDNDFASSYLKGAKSDFDVIKDYTEVVNGDIVAWNNLLNTVNAGVEDPADYQHLLGKNPDGSRNPGYEKLVDVDNLCDYMLINFYGANWDWDEHNWVAIRNRNDREAGFRFFCWDSEHVLESVTANNIGENSSGCPSRVFQQLRKNTAFRRTFADHVQQQCFNGGSLTPERAAERWKERSAEIYKALLAESARWGDYRRDVHQYQPQGPFDLYTRDKYWLPENERLVNSYFPARTGILVSQLRAVGLFPDADAPTFLLNGSPVDGRAVISGDILSMNAADGDIYFTSDGKDPAEWPDQGDQSSSVDAFAGSISPFATQYSGPIALTHSGHYLARAYENGEWSAVTELFFTFPTDFYDIKITEINYHPFGEGAIDSKEFEFIELKNTGSATINLQGMRIASGIGYVFKTEKELRPGGFIVLASNSDQFYNRYGFVPDGQFDGQLSNGGEQVALLSPSGDTLSSVWYNQDDRWSSAADGHGYSLVPVDLNPTGDQDDAVLWRASLAVGGSPGADDVPPSSIIAGIVEPPDITLYQNIPNPFSGITQINYKLSADARVSLTVIDLLGRKVADLADEFQHAGSYQVSWSGTDIHHNPLPEGIYLYQLIVISKNSHKTLNRRLVIIR